MATYLRGIFLRSLTAGCTFTLLAAGGQGEEPPKATPETLVEMLVGENLPRTSQSRVTRRTLVSQAAAALVAMGDRAVPALERALDSEDSLQRLNVVFVLSRIDAPAALAARLRAVRDRDTEVRALAIRLLPVHASDEAHQAAWAAFSDSVSEVQKSAMLAYAAHYPTDRQPKFDKYIVAKRIAEFLKEEELRPTAAWVLGRLKSNVAADPLLAAMRDARSEVRFEILNSLAKIGDKQTAVGIAGHLSDAEVGVRCAAASALGELRDLRATPGLVAALADSEPPVRRDAAAALGMVGDWRAVARLIPLLEDPEEDVGRSAAKALADIGDRQAVPALIKALERKDDRALAAAEALGRLGDPQAISALGRYLETNVDAEVVAQALAKIRHPQGVAELARIASTINSPAARRGLRTIADVNLDFHPPEEVAQWWKENREHFLRPLPAPRP